MKKRLENLQETFSQIRTKKLSFFDEISVYHIFLVWVLVVVMFGVSYHFLSGRYGYLFSAIARTEVTSLFDAIYFSFIMATSTGNGEIVPQGIHGVIAVIEVTFGLLLLAFVTSKMVSVKQNLILDEIYEISFKEKVNRMRSNLLLFRQNVNRTINHVEEGSIRRREVNDLYIYMNTLESVLEEMIPLMVNEGKHNFAKVIDPVNTELLVNSIQQSFGKALELVATLSEHKMEWKRPVMIATIQKCIELNEKLFSMLMTSPIKNSTITSLLPDNIKIINKIREIMQKEELKTNESNSAQDLFLDDIFQKKV